MRCILYKSGIASIILLAFITVGCQVGGSGAFIQGRTPDENNATYTGEPVTGDWVVMNLLDEPENLNPYISTSASATNIYNGYIFESFVSIRREPPWDDEPLLAASLPEISDDHLRYKWHLRPEARWNDGTALTMLDAEFSLKSIMNPYVDDLPSKPYYQELDSLDVIDDYTLQMYCSRPYFQHVEYLGGFSVIPKHIYDEKGLMDDLSYFQVTLGSNYGQVADLLETDQELSWDELFPAVTLAGLEKSIESVSDEKVSFKEMIKSLPNWDNQAADVQLSRVKAYLNDHPDGAPVSRWITQRVQSLSKAVNILPLATEISQQASPGTFPMRAALSDLCRDIHTRIETFGTEFNQHPQNRAPVVGSGTFVFDHWTTGQEIVLRRNDNYWQGEGHAYLDRLVFRVLTDYTASLVALKNGEIDFMESLQTIQYLTMTNRKKFLDEFIKGTYLVPSYSYLGWNMGKPLFADKQVRNAMTHMVRRKDIAEKLLFGFAEIVTGPFYRYGQDYDSTIVPLKYNPEKAIELLTEAGWEDVDGDGILEKDSLEFRFEMLIPSGSPTAEQLASILREDLFMIGIEMEIRTLEWSVFINNYIRNHNFDACYLGWVFGMRGDPKQVWHSESATGRGSNHVEFKNAEVDSLIDAARVEFDLDKRVSMYHRFQQILHEEQPYTFCFSSMRKPAYDNRFKGVKWYPFRPGYQFDEWFVPEAEQKFK